MATTVYAPEPGQVVYGAGLARRYGRGVTANRTTTLERHAWIEFDDKAIGNDGLLLVDIDLLSRHPS